MAGLLGSTTYSQKPISPFICALLYDCFLNAQPEIQMFNGLYLSMHDFFHVTVVQQYNFLSVLDRLSEASLYVING